MFSLRSFAVLAVAILVHDQGVVAKPLNHLERRQCSATLDTANVRICTALTNKNQVLPI